MQARRSEHAESEEFGMDDLRLAPRDSAVGKDS